MMSQAGDIHVCVSCFVMSDSLSPTDCSPPDSSVRGILQARKLEWVSIPFSRGSSWPRNRVWVSCIAGDIHSWDEIQMCMYSFSNIFGAH